MSREFMQHMYCLQNPVSSHWDLDTVQLQTRFVLTNYGAVCSTNNKRPTFQHCKNSFKMIFNFYLPPIRASCWLAPKTLHWSAPQHPQTINWPGPRSNQVRCGNHSGKLNGRKKHFKIEIKK